MYAVDRYVSVNDYGTAVLFQQLIANPVRRVVVASSMSIYGEGLYRTADGRCGGRGAPAARPAPARLGTRWTTGAARSFRSPRRSGSGPRSPPSTPSPSTCRSG
jgi:nucleoside-diphosphate-sugar epimerase